MSKAACPHCGAIAIRETASKCPACKRWVGPKPRRPLGKLGVFATAFGLMAAGAVAGVIGTVVSLRGASVSPPAGAASADGSSPLAAPPSEASGSAAPPAASSSAAPAAIPASPFGPPRTIKLDFAPADVAISEDDATAFALGDDGVLHAIALETGREVHRVTLGGRPTKVRRLDGGRIALLGGAGPLQIVDVANFTVQKVDVGGGPVDAVGMGDPRVVLVASSSRRLTRFAADGFKSEGQVTFARPIGGLVALDGGGHPLLAVLEQGRRGGLPGSIELFDPSASPFAGARSAVSVGFDPRRGSAHEGGAALLIADRVSGQLIEVTSDHAIRVAPVGKTPLAAFRLASRWAVTIDASGSAAVSDTRAKSLDPVATLALGGSVSDFAATPDGLTLFVALGGGGRERGTSTAIVGGDPPVVLGKVTTGAGSHAVAVGTSGRTVIVAAYWARSLMVFTNRSPG